MTRYHSKHRRPSWLPVPAKTWYVEVRLPPSTPGNTPVVYALGPLGQWSRAREIAEQWERQHGARTTAVHERLAHLTASLARRVETVSAAGTSRT